MSREIMDGINVLVCDWKNANGNPCDLGMDGDRKTFIDPDPRTSTDTYYQCGEHHGVMKQEDRPEYQLPEGHELQESTLLKDDTIDPDKDVAVRIDGLNPDVKGQVWNGDKGSVVWDKPKE